MKKNKIVNSFIWKFAERLISQGISFFISLVLARLLSPDDYGGIALVLVFINLANVFVTSGFATALIQKKDADAIDFSTNFWCSFVCSIFVYVVLFFAAPYISAFYEDTSLTLILRVFAIQIPISSYNAIQNAYISRNMIFDKNFVTSLISGIISGIIGIIMAVLGCGVWALVTQSISVVIVRTIVCTCIVPWHVELKFSVESAKSMMKYGTKILGADLSGTFFGELRSLMVGKVYSSVDLAFYTKGQQVPTLITGNISNAIMSVLFPAIANESDNLSYVKQLTKKSMQVMSYIIFPMLFGLAAVMDVLIVLMYTDKWSQSIPFAQLLCIGAAIGVLGTISLQTFKAIGRSDIVLGLEVWKKPAYVLLLIIGININVLGVAITMVLYEMYGTFVNMWQLKKYISYGLKEQFVDLVPQFAMSTIMAGIVFLLPNLENIILTLLFKVLVGFIVYILMSIVFNVSGFTYVKKILIDYFGKGRR